MSNYLEPAKCAELPKVEVATLLGGPIGDITDYMSFMSVQSSLDDPFMKMHCTFSDDEAIMRNYNINGDKSLIISITAGDGKSISGKFHINNVKFNTVNGRKSAGVHLYGMTAEHLNNAAQKVMESRFLAKPTKVVDIIRFVWDSYIRGDIDYNVSSTPSVKLLLPMQSPMQTIAFLLERCKGVGENMYVLYQKFKGGAPKFQLDEVSILAKAGPKRTAVMTENAVGEEAHIIDKEYVGGGNSRILDFHQNSMFDVHSMTQQGYWAKEYGTVDIITKICDFTKDKSQNVLMGGGPIAPEVGTVAKKQVGPRETRTIYDIHNSDTSYFPDPELKDATLKPKTPASGMLNSRIDIVTYGFLDCHAGDVLKILYKVNKADPGREIDRFYSRNHLIHTAKHSVSTNGEVYSQFTLLNDTTS